jgi:hypothetical protein
MKQQKFKYCFYLLFFIPLLFSAQFNDAGLWTGLNIERKLTKKLSVNLNPEMRFNENITELGTWFVDGGLSYRVSKNWKVFANYRFAQKRRLDDSYSIRHRYYFDLAYRIKIKKIVVGWRLRFQEQYNDWLTSDDGKIPSQALRNKIQLKYNADGKFQPFVSADVWYSMSYKIKQFDNFRLVGGLDYELNKYSSITLAYLWQREFNVKNPGTDYIVSLGYNYSF